MSEFNMKVISPSIHLADMLNGECNCSPAEKEAVVNTVLAQGVAYERLIRHLKLLKGGTSDGYTYDLASDLLDEFLLR